MSTIFRKHWTSAVGICAGLTLGLSASMTGAVAFEYQMQTRYAASMAGFKFAHFSFNLDLAGDRYSVTSVGRARGLAWLFTNAEGQAKTHGEISGGKLFPATYSMTSQDKGKNSSAAIRYAKSKLGSFSADPPFKDNQGRVKLNKPSLNGTVDPLTAMLAGFGAEKFHPDVCNKTIRVFDGWQQFDLALRFAKVENLSIAGYRGPAIACSMRYTPIGGYKPALQGVTHLIRGNHKMWLVPTNVHRGLVLARLDVDTIMGPLRLSLTNLTLTQQVAAAADSKPIVQAN
jgi:hypothetical protein